MIEKGKIETLVNELVKESGIFVVSVRVSSTNKVTVLVDTTAGITIDECASLHRKIKSRMDEENEDYELQVSSPGLDMPFLVPEQYKKNEGKKVEVLDTMGKKRTGILKNITAGGFELETEVRIKGKMDESQEISFNFDQVKSTRIILTIK